MYTIQLHKCTPKQCVVLRGLRESTKYAVYIVRCIYPVFGLKCRFFCIYLGGGLLKLSGRGDKPKLVCLYLYKLTQQRAFFSFYENIFCTLFQISEMMYANSIASPDGHGSFANNVKYLNSESVRTVVN